MKGWRVALKGLRPLPRRRGSALALGCGRSGCGRGGRVVLPLPRAAAKMNNYGTRAAAVSTGLR